MSRHSKESIRSIAYNNDTLEIIKEEQGISTLSIKINHETIENSAEINDINTSFDECICVHCGKADRNEITPEQLEKKLQEQEATLRHEFKVYLEAQIHELKDKFDYILQNEQVRASCMLREAHRERQEKVRVLQAQLQCKNLAALMCVMCAERRRGKLEKHRLVEEYTSYIRSLQAILSEGRELILRLSRGYKTAARVDHEWRKKLMKIIHEFQAYIHNYGGSSPESNQYLLDLPSLLKTKVDVYPEIEDPCEVEEEEQCIEPKGSKPWFELMGGDGRPFVVFGDMAEFRPPQRRKVLEAVTGAKTAPSCWKDYVFNEVNIRSACSNLEMIKDQYVKINPPFTGKWECGMQTDRRGSWMSTMSRRVTTTSTDARGNMGSILKIIASNIGQPEAKTTLLGAKDSMEIASVTKLRETRQQPDPASVVLNLGRRRHTNECLVQETWYGDEHVKDNTAYQDSLTEIVDDSTSSVNSSEEAEVETTSTLGIHKDSLRVIPPRVPPKDKINYEKVCPMEKCHHERVDSFMQSLPPYMKASPFMHYEQTFDGYQTCSPEQLEILKQRVEEKKKKERIEYSAPEDPLAEWDSKEDGVGVQTSQDSLPPCTCVGPSPTPASSDGWIFDMEDLAPFKQILDDIRKECFFDKDIEFNRFQVIGQEKETEEEIQKDTAKEENFTEKRLQEIKKILEKHPSLCEIFLADAKN